VNEMCSCGRPLLTWAGDMQATCAGCRSTPDSCDCERITPGQPRKAARTRHHVVLPPPGGEAADLLPDEPWTELGYARRLAEAYRGRVRYVHTWKRWLVWDGRRWAHDQTGQVQRWAKIIARGMTNVVLASDDEAFIRDHYPIARKGETSASVASVLNLASSEEGIATAHGDLDADPFLLNCTNGTLDLRTGELRAHDPADLLTKMAGAAHCPDAPCPAFAKFLEDVQPDAGMRAFLARLIGHALEGRVVEHILPIFCGEGANGKSTLVTAIVAALGDYAAPADPDLLMARSWDAHPTGVADLCGVRLARIDEGDKGRHLGEGTVKRLTGGDRIKARRMREDFWWFDPTHTFLMLTNHKPVVTGTDEGIWRRVRLVPWDVVIPDEKRDPELGNRLALELDAILAWMVAGYGDWKAHGLGEPDAVAVATAAYRNESDALARFLTEKCMRHGRVKSSDLFMAWQKWCAAESEEAGTQTAFSNELTNRGFDKVRENSGMFWQGLGLGEE
jgi:putative DNA primase/helicase